jgi:hypothetical protein
MFDQATAAREVASVSLNSRTSKIRGMPICFINLKKSTLYTTFMVDIKSSLMNLCRKRDKSR